MFPLTYDFFDYKGDIPGYNGWDFDHGPAQTIYVCTAAALILLLLILTRKAPREEMPAYFRRIGVCLALFYAVKVIWETVHDLQLPGGSFNWYLLPLDTCSLVTPASLIFGFGKGRAQRCAGAWITTGGMVGGIGAMVKLTALQYYPILTYGAFYSMLWHAAIVYLGLWLIITAPAPLRFRDMVLNGFAFHLVCSVPIIAADYLFDWDFMFYKEMSALPVLDGVAERLIDGGLFFLVPVIMIAVYFVCFCIIFGVAALMKNLPRRRKPDLQ